MLCVLWRAERKEKETDVGRYRINRMKSGLGQGLGFSTPVE